MQQKIGVFYLARIAEGPKVFERFAESYRKHAAGEAHDLYLICKGILTPEVRSEISEIFHDITYTTLEVPDEGFDIHAYLYAAEIVPNSELCLFNTFAILLSSDWLKKLATQYRKPGVGIAGMSASYESIHDSWGHIIKSVWLPTTGRIRYNGNYVSQFCQRLVDNIPTWIRPRFSKYYRLRRMLSDIYHRRARVGKESFESEFAKHWGNVTAKGAPYGAFRHFRRFPNPHLRSNGFLISKDLLLEFRGLEKTKMGCVLFESGPEGLSNRVMERGLEIMLVGANGVGYPIADWPKSQTFRLGDQSNLMATDNRVLEYETMSEPERKVLARLTWGDYAGPAFDGFLDLGFKFAAIPVTKEQPPIKISIVIPTRNRRALVRDAIETVLRQKYENWELIIFDNASTDDTANIFDTVKDPRVRYEKSSEFLPVTDSWNTAIDFAKGDYVMLIGDDDGVVPGFFDKINTLVASHDNPDFIYSSLYQFMHPGVLPTRREGSLIELRSAFFFTLGHNQPFFLTPEQRYKAWTGSLDFKRNFTFYMQAFTFKRSFLDSLRIDGKVFQSPFPDYYLANISMAKGQRVLISPEPLAVSGVSTASFGFTLFNGLENRGADILKSNISGDPLYKEYEKQFLPGPRYQDNYIITMGHVAKHLPKPYSTALGIARYRHAQILGLIRMGPSVFTATAMKLSFGKLSWILRPVLSRYLGDLGAGQKKSVYERSQFLWKRLSVKEKLWALNAIRTLKFSFGTKEWKKIENLASETQFPAVAIQIAVGEFARLPEVFEMLESASNEPIYRYSLKPSKTSRSYVGSAATSGNRRENPMATGTTSEIHSREGYEASATV